MRLKLNEIALLQKIDWNHKKSPDRQDRFISPDRTDR